nr:heterodisulfide reductase-related iron-sulfur binding cluster [Candidatus Sigynarchaeota archaeon]
MDEKQPRRRTINEERLNAIPAMSDKIFYFQGCTERAYPGINGAFIDACKAMGNTPVTSNEQSCCTGNFLAFNTAPLETVLAITQRNYNVIKKASASCVTTCNGCFSSFHNCDAYFRHGDGIQARVKNVLKKIGKTYIEDVIVFHAAEFLYKNRDLLVQHAKHTLDGVKIAVHYGCHFLHQEDPRALLDDFENPGILEELLGGLQASIVEYRERLLCCGAGLNQRMLHDDRINSLKITRRKLASIKQHAPDAIVVVCPYCLLHLDSAQAELEVEFDETFDIPVLHLTELIGILFDLPPEVLQLAVHRVPVDAVVQKIGYQG